MRLLTKKWWHSVCAFRSLVVMTALNAKKTANKAKPSAENCTASDKSRDKKDPILTFGLALSAVHRILYCQVNQRLDTEISNKRFSTLATADTELNELKNLLLTQYNVSDRASAIEKIQYFYNQHISDNNFANIYDQLQAQDLLYANNQKTIWDFDTTYRLEAVLAVQQSFPEIGLKEKSGNAYSQAVIAFLVTSSLSLGYIEHIDASEFLHPVVRETVELFEDWNHFSLSFIAGEKTCSHSEYAGSKDISNDEKVKNAIHLLKSSTKGSWQLVNWTPPKKPKRTFQTPKADAA